MKIRMNPGYGYMLLAILCEVAATSALKASEQFTRWLPSGVVVAGYCAAFYLLSLCLKTVGVGVAYVRVGDSDPVLQSHYQFQIRTFWIGLLYLAIGISLYLLGIAYIGIPILAWWFLWSLTRTIKGIRLVNGSRPIANPRSLLFG